MAEKNLNKIDEKTQQQIQGLQSLEQALHNLLMQKQAFQIELNETNASLDEIEKTNDDIFKMVGQIMVKAKKQELQKELKKKKELIELRLKTLEEQEKSITEEAEKLKKEIMSKLK